jgi:hypothetical protein
MYLLISSIADNITQLNPAVTHLSCFIQSHGSEKIFKTPNLVARVSPHWTYRHSMLCLQSAFAFYMISEQTAITSSYSSNWFTDKISFFGLCTASKFKKPVLLPYSGKEAPNLVDTFDRVILSHCAPQKH